MSIFALVFIGIATVLLASFLRGDKPEYAVLAVAAGSIVLLFFVSSDIGKILDYLSGIFSSGGVTDVPS